MVLVLDAGGTQLQISKVDEPRIAPHTALGWRVERITDAVMTTRVSRSLTQFAH